MALMLCPECSSTISDKAQSCPKCGFPIMALQKKQSAKKNVFCLECKAEFPINDEVCPNCGLFNSQKYANMQCKSEEFTFEQEIRKPEKERGVIKKLVNNIVLSLHQDAFKNDKKSVSLKCSGCSKKIEYDLASCPFCGEINPTNTYKNRVAVITVGGSLVGILGILAICSAFIGDEGNSTIKQTAKVSESKPKVIESETELYKKAQSIPASDLEANRDIYKKLLDVNKNSKLYKEKHESYQAKIVQRDKIAQTENNNKAQELIIGLVREKAISLDIGSSRVYVEPDFWNMMDYSRKQAFCSLIIDSLPTYSIHDKYSGKRLAKLNFLGEVSIDN